MCFSFTSPYFTAYKFQVSASSFMTASIWQYESLRSQAKKMHQFSLFHRENRVKLGWWRQYVGFCIFFNLKLCQLFKKHFCLTVEHVLERAGASALQGKRNGMGAQRSTRCDIFIVARSCVINTDFQRYEQLVQLVPIRK